MRTGFDEPLTTVHKKIDEVAAGGVGALYES